MDRLWSPWRSEHIHRTAQQRKEERGSIFERMIDEEADEDNYILWRGEESFIAMNLYPYNPGHLLVLPYRRVTHVWELTSAEREALMDGLERAMNCLENALAPDGFHTGMNLGEAAGAGIPEHLHMHVVPRWTGDIRHIPAEGELDDLEAAMDAMYARLRDSV